MAVGIRLKFAGGTQEQYQAVHDTVNAEQPARQGRRLARSLSRPDRRRVGRDRLLGVH
jgi:hypothetical protein